MPIIYKTKNNGAFILDANLSTIDKDSLLTSNTVVQIGKELITDTSFYAQTATDLNIGLGYSQSVWESSHGMLVGGVKANLHKITLGRALAKIDDTTDVDDVISDGLSDDSASSTDVGLDFGVIWVSHYYQTGLTIANLNEPEFDGVPITTNAASDKYGIAAVDLYTMERQATIEAAVSTLDKQVMLGMTYDINSVKDATGDEYQWAAASLSYYGDSLFFPGIRVGFRQNLAGSKLSYASGGVTILKRFNLDIAVALDTIEDDEGSSTPRSFYVSLGYDTAF